MKRQPEADTGKVTNSRTGVYHYIYVCTVVFCSCLLYESSLDRAWKMYHHPAGVQRTGEVRLQRDDFVRMRGRPQVHGRHEETGRLLHRRWDVEFQRGRLRLLVPIKLSILSGIFDTDS